VGLLLIYETSLLYIYEYLINNILIRIFYMAVVVSVLRMSRILIRVTPSILNMIVS
jgi:hypothetical protein